MTSYLAPLPTGPEEEQLVTESLIHHLEQLASISPELSFPVNSSIIDDDYSDNPPFKLLGLPLEVRRIIYRHAMHKNNFFPDPAVCPLAMATRRQPRPTFPALLSVCHQIRQEASPVFYRSNLFPLTLQPQPHTEITVLGFDKKTHAWFDLIGVKHTNSLRHIAFQFPVTVARGAYHKAANMYYVNLSSSDASNWVFQTALSEHGWRSLQEGMDQCVLKRTHLLAWLIGNVTESHIKCYKAAIQRAQDAQDRFIDTCAVGKCVKPTIDALGILGGALVAVEEARLISARD
jgi:hypothetical protein